MVAGIDPELRTDRNQRARFSVLLDHIHLFQAGENGATIRSANRWPRLAAMR